MSKNFRETLNSQLKNDPEFRREYESLSPEYEIAECSLPAETPEI